MSSRSSFIVAAVLLAGACASGCGGEESPVAATTGSIPSTDGSVVDSGDVSIEAMQTVLDDFVALAPAEQELQLAELDARIERELWTLSGLEAALGGAEAADAAFAEQSQAIVDRARSIATQPIAMSGFRATASAPSIGMGMFGGAMVVSIGAEGIVTATNDLKDGESGTASPSEGTTISASREHAEMTVDFSQESKGVTTKLHVKVEVSPCPDPDGHFEAKAVVDVSTTTSGGSTGQKGTLDVTVTGQVDDDANLASSDSDYRMQWADFAGGKGSFVDVAGSIGDTKVTGATVNRTGGAPSATLQQDASTLGMLYAMLAKTAVAEAAQKGWQSGRCVRLEATAAPGPKGLKPAATSTITASPRSRIDGGPTGGTVTATLSAGEAGVEPSATKVPADATFTYTAAGEVGKGGTVSMEARSKRGVAKATIDFDTAGSYTASGGTEVTFSGTVADLAAPFTLAGLGQGFEVTFSFTPSGPTAGALTYTGTGDGFTIEGSGTYTISGADPDPLTLTYNANGCVNIGGCRATTNAITLTRASA